MVKPGTYVPDRGDAVWLEFDPQAGYEQAGKRPAVVLSPAAYNAKSSLALVCPITRQVKGYPFECALPSDLPIAGVVLADQVRSLDWRARRAFRICQLPDDIVDEISAKVWALIGND